MASDLARDREAAWKLLTEFTQSESLLKHALSVEAAMRAYARRLGGDPDLWGVVGLLHDLDYEKHPTREEHPLVGARILAERGYPEEVIRAVKSHASYLGIERISPMEKALFACDELCGFITAVALVRPNKSVHEVTVQSVKKKMKDKAFARSVNREEIVEGAQELGLPLEEHIQNVIDALREVAPQLGLDGGGQAGSQGSQSPPGQITQTAGA